MIVTGSVTRGFQHEIREKVIGMGGHLQITSIGQTDPKETPRTLKDRSFYPVLDSLPEVDHIQVFATLPGIIETPDEIQGVVVKGVGADLDPTYLQDHLVEGHLLELDRDEAMNEVVISTYLKDLLRIALSDTITVYLVQGREEIRPRRFRIVGIYSTGLEQVDHQLVLIDIRHIQRFAQWGLQAQIAVVDSCGTNGVQVEGRAFGGDRVYDMEWTGTDLRGPGPHAVCVHGDTTLQLVVHDAMHTLPDTAWLHLRPRTTVIGCPCTDELTIELHTSGGSDKDYVGGFEVALHDLKDLDRMDDVIYRDHLDPDLKSVSIRDRYPEIFAWLELLDTNVVVVIVLMVVVAIINMTSALLIIILERTRMIGVLKALGGTNGLVQRIFLIDGAYILGVGLLLGDALGIGICLVQRWTGLVKLPVETYYLSIVPVDISFWPILLLNIGTLLTCVTFLVLPSLWVTRIAPARAIRFD